MLKQSRIFIYGTLFLFIFAVKMFIAVAPVIFQIDKKLVNAAIMQLELENETKDCAKDAKDINKLFKKSTDFIHVYNLAFNCSTIGLFLDHHYISKKYLNLYFPAVPTPPPNFS